MTRYTPKNKENTVLNWSSGKDASMAYFTLLQEGRYNVTHLLTTLSAEHERVFMHGVRMELLDMQAERMKLPLIKLLLPASPDDNIYKKAMLETLTSLKDEGVTTAAYGDIFLEDLRIYREAQLQQAGFNAIFPIWKRDTWELVLAIDASGIDAVVVCVNAKVLGKEFLGKKIDADFLNSLPANVDPCGENGEFHTFVRNAPFFSAPISITFGEIVHKSYTPSDNDAGGWDTGFYFMDALPG